MYAPIEEHAAIGDGRTVALIDRTGRIDWLPLPALDSEPVFAALLDDENGGCVELAPVAEHEMTRRYVPGTNVLETTYTTAHGKVRVTDALVTGIAGRLPWSELARCIDGLEGIVEMRWAVTPGTALGRRSPWIEVDAAEGDDRAVIRVGDLSLGVVGDGVGTPQVGDGGPSGSLGARFRVREGSVHTLSVSATDREPLHIPNPRRVRDGIDRTIAEWRRWSDEFHWDGPWRAAVTRSALALKLLIFSPEGSIAAAATTSLPESPQGGKNWDYRFAWVRDLAYTVGALVHFGLREETHAALSWLLRTLKDRGPDIHIFYTLRGDVDGHVEELAAPGWRGIGPVVHGNRAKDQLQLGVFGDLFGIVRAYIAEGDGNVLDVETGRFLADVADRVCDSWRLPDAGMWELEEERHYTSSKMGCWQALDSAIWLAEHGHVVDRSARWRGERQRVREFVESECWSEERGAYTMWPGSGELDASVLLHAPSDFDRGPRMSSTIDVLRGELGAGHRIYRYSGMRGEERPFVACGYWVATALACVGRRPEAVELMDELVADTGDVGLLAEMIAEDGSHWGNTPQALSHLALIDAAVTITRLAEEHGDRIPTGDSGS